MTKETTYYIKHTPRGFFLTEHYSELRYAYSGRGLRRIDFSTPLEAWQDFYGRQRETLSSSRQAMYDALNAMSWASSELSKLGGVKHES